MNASTLLRAHHVTIGYREPGEKERVLATDLSLDLHGGELVCLIGPNGVGKSTLIRTLSGMQAALAGHVELAGHELGTMDARTRARHLAVVLTERTSVGMLTAYLLVSLGRHPHTGWTGRLTRRDHEMIRWALRAVGAEDLSTRSVEELSDGERQKIMIARALAQEPVLLVLDEPTAFLDLPRRVEMMRVLRHLAHTTGRAILLSTHDLDLALRSADRLWIMAMDGTLVDGGPEDLVLNGGLDAAFRSEHMRFDAATGSFRLTAAMQGTATVEGKGVPAQWAARALERAGYTIVASPPSSVVVTVSGDESFPIYVARRSASESQPSTREFSQLQDLVQWIAPHTEKRSNTLLPMQKALMEAVRAQHEPNSPAPC